MPCAVCQDLNHDALPQLRPGQRCTLFVWSIDLHRSVATTDCQNCGLLVDALTTAQPTPDSLEKNRSLRINLAEGKSLELWDGASGVYLDIFSSRHESRGGVIPTTIGPGVSIPKRSDSPESIALMLGWLRQCEAEHELCKRSNPQAQPSRLLHLHGSVDDLNIRLVDTDRLQPRYVALSYCWGNPTEHYQLKTTRKDELVERHQSGISLNALPQTIKDAVALTKVLGFEYLWVDALCIIQDDETDWSFESSKMCDVYMNASVTLISSRSTGCSDHLLGEQSYSKHMEMPYKNTTLFVRDSIARDHLNDPMATADWAIDPLVTRAWALQEGMLSTRAIYFSSRELRWECNETSECQCGIISMTGRAKDEFDHRAYRAPALFNFGTIQEAYTAWAVTLMAYSNRYLTFEGDRLVALSGLAQQFSNMITLKFGVKECYLAGIWAGSLPQSLMWQIEPSNFSFQRGRQHYRPSVWRAPSWSWAAMEAPIFQPHLDKMESQIMVLEWRFESASPNSFGQLRSASLRIRGPLLAHASPVMSQPREVLARYHALIVHGLHLRVDTLFPDEDNKDLPESISVLVVGYLSSDVHQALLLEAVDFERAVYRRLGVARLGAHFREPSEHKKLIVEAPLMDILLV